MYNLKCVLHAKIFLNRSVKLEATTVRMSEIPLRIQDIDRSYWGS